LFIYCYVNKPRKRLPGETTEFEFLRFDRDLENQSYRDLLSEALFDAMEQEKYAFGSDLVDHIMNKVNT